MIYQEKFNLTESNSLYFSKQFNILITGFREDKDDRHMYIRKLLSSYKGLVYSFDTCENAEKFHYKIETENNILLEYELNKSLIPDLQMLIKKKEFEGANICIDITTLKQGILFLLISIFLKEIKPSRLFAAYTEPKDLAL